MRLTYLAAKAAAALAVATLSSSCASLGDPFLLAFDVEPKYQAQAVTSTGIAEYREKLVTQGDVSSSARVQRYFEAALRYDPTNAEAARYLALVEDYRASRFSAYIKKAESISKKPDKSPDDQYAMLVSIRHAVDIYPRDDSATKLLKSTADLRKAYVKARLSEAETIRASVKPESKDSVKERALIEAFNLVIRANEVEPRDVEGTKAYRELRADIAGIVKKRLSSVDALYAKASFEEAKSMLALVKELDSKIGRAFNAEIRTAEYGLYLSWAKYHEGRKEWSKADVRIRTALAIQRGSDAVALQKRIAAAADAEERGSTFDAGLKNLDGYIAKGELLKAQRLLASLSKSTSDSGHRRSLDQRRKTMVESLSGIYAAGVKAYREERFKDAVSSFETVVAIDSSYEDASDYLEKSRDKQKLLDQY